MWTGRDVVGVAPMLFHPSEPYPRSITGLLVLRPLLLPPEGHLVATWSKRQKLSTELGRAATGRVKG